MTDLPPHIANALDQLGIVLLVKKPQPKPEPKEKGWVPAYQGEEPLF